MAYEHRSEGDLVPEHPGAAGPFVVLLFRQKGIRELARGKEKRRDAKAPNRASKRLLFVVGAQIGARAVPHAHSK